MPKISGKQKTFHTIRCTVCPYEISNTSKRVIRSRDQSLSTSVEIKAALGKQEVSE